MLKLTIRTDNAAFDPEPGPELAAILRTAADRLEQGQPAGNLRDSNGNTVGQFALTNAKRRY